MKKKGEGNVWKVWPNCFLRIYLFIFENSEKFEKFEKSGLIDFWEFGFFEFLEIFENSGLIDFWEFENYELLEKFENDGLILISEYLIFWKFSKNWILWPNWFS